MGPEAEALWASPQRRPAARLRCGAFSILWFAVHLLLQSVAACHSAGHEMYGYETEPTAADDVHSALNYLWFRTFCLC